MLSKVRKLLGNFGRPKDGDPSFNAIVEGTYHDEVRKLRLKICSLDPVSPYANILEDGDYRFVLHGKMIEGYNNLTLLNPEEKIEQELSTRLSMYPGIEITSRNQSLVPGLFSTARSVALRDGRIFIRENETTQYIDALEDTLLDLAEKAFTDPDIDENFRQVKPNLE